MRRPPALLALVLLAAPAAAADAPADAFKPLAFLAGHCWKGGSADGRRTDEHCFAWMLDGRGLRDTHVVRAPGQDDARGETVYYVNSATKRIEYLYVESGGGFSRGTVEPQADAILFPDAPYVDEGQTLTVRARWTPRGASEYEAWAEAKTREGWSTLFRTAMKSSRRSTS